MVRTMASKKLEILSLVLAGGKGERLYPLTLERTKPSVPFGGKYRIIDFALSNLVNSGLYAIYVLVQYKSQSLIEHIRTTWVKTGVLPKHFITTVPPQMRREDISQWYRGTADSVYQNINLIYDFKPDLVAIFGGDHVYRMDINHMIDFHIAKKADLTISVLPVAAEEACQFGILHLDENRQVKRFQEKPLLKGRRNVWASMGNYIFKTQTLVEVLESITEQTKNYDFGRDIIPYLVKRKAKVYGYDFSKNKIPGLKPYEDKFYWQDVGTIESYWNSHMHLLGRYPRLDLDNQLWPIYASNLNAPAAYTVNSSIENCLICEGAKIYSANIKNSIIGRGVIIEEGVKITDSIIMDFTIIGKNSLIERAIIDRFNTINPKTIISFRQSKLPDNCINSSGIVVMRRGSRKLFYW